MPAIVVPNTKLKKLFDGAKHTERVIYFLQDDSVVFSDVIGDRQGNILTSSADSVRVYDFEGNLLGKIFIPEVVANLTLGGKNGKILFIAAGTSLYEIELK